ncbi:dephospho-CoA kinase [soil metagenome]
MPILGITGGIASGKSTFLSLLQSRVAAGYFDTDAYARRLLNEDEAVREQILHRIHPAAYSDGIPNRPLLRDLVYADAAKKTTLEEILHPLIRQAWLTRAEASDAQGKLYVVDIPLLFETKAEELFDRIVTIACSVETQLSRLALRRGLDPEISNRIIKTQWPIEAKISGSHHVIWNDGSLQPLTDQTDLFSSYLNARYG